MTYIDIQHFLKNSFIRHFNNKREGSLTGIGFSIIEDSHNKGEDIIFLNGISFKGPNKGDGIDQKISFKLELNEIDLIENNILSFLGYEKDFSEKIKTKNQQLSFESNSNGLKLIFKKEGINEEISFELNILEIYKLLKILKRIKYLLNNRNDINLISILNDKFNHLGLNDMSTFQVNGSDGNIKNIQKTTIQYSSINVTKDKKLAGSFLKYRNEYLFEDKNIENKNLLGSKYPMTIVTQESGYSFSLPIEEELSILLEKFLKAYTLEENGRNNNFLTEKEEKLLKQQRIIGVYNNRGTDMLQFKIYSESGTIQYSINSKDKSLTVSRMGIATTSDITRVRNSLLKIQKELKEGNINEDYKKKLTFKYKNLLEFGKKLDYSNKNNKSYFTTFLKIENPLEFIFHLNLINSYLMNPLKYEKDILFKNVNNLFLNIEKGNINKDDKQISSLMNDLNKVFKKEFFEVKIEFDKHVSFSYDSRFVNKLLNQEENRGEKTFKFKFTFDGKNTQLSLSLNDIKKLKDHDSFEKIIDYELDGTKIYKKFSIIKENNNLNYIYEINNKKYEGNIKSDIFEKFQKTLHNDIIINDIYFGNYLNKNFSYLSYKINNFKPNNVAKPLNKFKK